jgi:hypothetical protein
LSHDFSMPTFSTVAGWGRLGSEKTSQTLITAPLVPLISTSLLITGSVLSNISPPKSRSWSRFKDISASSCAGASSHELSKDSQLYIPLPTSWKCFFNFMTCSVLQRIHTMCNIFAFVWLNNSTSNPTIQQSLNKHYFLFLFSFSARSGQVLGVEGKERNQVRKRQHMDRASSNKSHRRQARKKIFHGNLVNGNFFQFNLSWDIVWIFSNQSKMQTE